MPATLANLIKNDNDLRAMATTRIWGLLEEWKDRSALTGDVEIRTQSRDPLHLDLTMS